LAKTEWYFICIVRYELVVLLWFVTGTSVEKWLPPARERLLLMMLVVPPARGKRVKLTNLA